MLSPMELREMSEHLIDVALRIGPEAEGVDIDESLALDELVQLRSHLSATRKAIDLVNSGLARLWRDTHGAGATWEDEYKVWEVKHTSVRRPTDADAFMDWFSKLPPERQATVVNPNRLADIIKKTALSPVEYDTLFIEEELEHRGISIQSRNKR